MNLDQAFVCGIVSGWVSLIGVALILYKWESRFGSYLKFKDFSSILPDPADKNWHYIGLQYPPDKRGGIFEKYPTYRNKNIEVYTGLGTYIDDHYISGSGKYTDDVLNAQTQLKMLQKALEE
ncbi:MAG TPA: hypothetical protein VHD33_08285 [Legionellaceae bacterium]|nr:hypothetical protein [Legionellaceae bacterium]